jgi:citrate lyase subunit beta/citryl-CoA lyase
MPREASLVRSWLFVPGDSERKLERAWDSEADALIVDLEDAVGPERKLIARDIARTAITEGRRGDKLVSVRVNSLDTGLALDDLDATFAARPDAYVLPKVMAPEDIRVVSQRIGALEAAHGRAPGSVRLIAIVTEHPLAVMRLDALCSADARTAGIMWGSEDLSAAIGARRVKDERGEMLEIFRTVRMLALLAASAHGLASLDTPVMRIDAPEEIEREARAAADMGFTGKVAIHPSQIAPIHRGFAPGAEELAFARGLIAAASTASGAFRYEGKMIDAPHVKAAQRLLAHAPTQA